jgi:cysteine synthase A
MSNILDSITQLVGQTPLLELHGYEQLHGLSAHLLAKLEWFNPSGSIKDRAAINMLEAAEAAGRIKPGDTVVENTSGNTGIGLAAFCAVKGYRLEVFLENGASVEREQMLLAYGATLRHYVDLPGMRKMLEEGSVDAERFMQEIYDWCDAQEGTYFFINQLTNQANPGAHIATTGPEIWAATDGKVDVVVCMVGTAGTIRGLSTYFRQRNPAVRIVAVDPAPESRVSLAHPETNIIDGVVPLTGVPDAALPPLWQVGEEVYDEIIDVKTEDAYVTARELARRDGILVGTSAAAATRAATMVARRPENAAKNIVIIMADNGDKYLSTAMYPKPATAVTPI